MPLDNKQQLCTFPPLLSFLHLKTKSGPNGICRCFVFTLVRAFEFVLGVLGVLSGHRKSIAKQGLKKRTKKEGTKNAPLKKRLSSKKGRPRADQK